MALLLNQMDFPATSATVLVKLLEQQHLLSVQRSELPPPPSGAADYSPSHSRKWYNPHTDIKSRSSAQIFAKVIQACKQIASCVTRIEMARVGEVEFYNLNLPLSPLLLFSI